MGNTKTDSQLLFYAKKSGVDFSHTCMLGRLQLYTSKEQITELCRKYGLNGPDAAFAEGADGYSEPLFKLLGASKTDSLDFSAYENATIIHDMNNPLPQNYHNMFSCIVDGGTLEHIFNFPVAVKNCMNALKVGGHFIGITPVNNQMGHGFYQFSPELLYRVFSEENGFKVVKMFISIESDDVTEWYEVADPKSVHHRVMLVNNVPLSIRFIAQKIAEKDVFKQTPQQSDYTTTWNAFQSVKESNAELSDSKFKYYVRKFVPYRVKVIAKNLYNIYKTDKVSSPTLGVINPEHFKKTEL